MTAATNLEPFNFENLPLLVDVVEPLWCPSIGSAEFKRFNVEYIIRNNIWENDYRFQLMGSDNETDSAATGNEIVSAAFFARKKDICHADEWFSRECNRFPEEWRTASAMSKTYLTMLAPVQQFLKRLVKNFVLKDGKIFTFGQIANATGSGILITVFRFCRKQPMSRSAQKMKITKLIFLCVSFNIGG